MPGSIPAAPTQPGTIPDWYKVGWRQASGIDEPRKGVEQSLLAEWVAEQHVRLSSNPLYVPVPSPSYPSTGPEVLPPSYPYVFVDSFV
jgi:hypothetical protein